MLFALVLVVYRFIFPGAFLTTVAPIAQIGASASLGVHSFSARFADAAALSAKVELLGKENAALASQNRVLSQQLADVGALTAAPQDIVAGVVSRPPESPYDTLLLASGSKDGVMRGMEVFGPGSRPLGVITSVTKSFSRATLFSAPGQLVFGWVGEAHTPVTLQGVGGGSFLATLPRSAGVAEGDVVYVPGPGAMPIGTVTKLSGDPSAPSVTLDIMPALNMYTITWVALRDTGASFRDALGTATTTP